MGGKASSKIDYPWLKKYPSEISWEFDKKPEPLYHLLDHTVSRTPDAPAIDFLGRVYTYRQVDDLVKRAAKGLIQLGVQKGTKVGLFMPNVPTFVIMYYAILKAGGVVVNYNPLYVNREIAHQIKDSETEIMVTLDLTALYPKVFDMIAEAGLKKIIVCSLKDQLPFPKNILMPIFKRKEVAKIPTDNRHVWFHDLINNDGKFTPIHVNALEDVAVIQYTGGTTGLPKGAMLTHANTFLNAHQAEQWYVRDSDKQEVILAALPLFHVFAMTAVMNIGITIGAKLVMMFPRFQVDEAIRLIYKHKVTFFPAVPTIYTLIINHPLAAQFDLSSMRGSLSGGAPLPVEVKRRFEELTRCIVVEAYGLSETSPAATCNPLEGLNKAGSIGLPFPGTIIKIMDLNDPMKEVPMGEKGEICVKGPQVMKGYWKRPAETAQALVDGLFHTGDVGYMDSDGYTFLVDRIKDLIICSGFNVYPRNVEEAIYMHPAVEETTVIGVPDPKRGETVKAFIKLKAGRNLSEDELINFLKDKLSAIEIPKIVEFRQELPKTMIGKLSKKELVAEELQKVETRKQPKKKAGKNSSNKKAESNKKKKTSKRRAES